MTIEISYLAWWCQRSIMMEGYGILIYTLIQNSTPVSLHIPPKCKCLLSFRHINSILMYPVTCNSFALKRMLIVINLNCKSWNSSAWISNIQAPLLLTLLGHIHGRDQIHPVFKIIKHADSMTSLPRTVLVCWFQSRSPLHPPWLMATTQHCVIILDVCTYFYLFPTNHH